MLNESRDTFPFFASIWDVRSFENEIMMNQEVNGQWMTPFEPTIVPLEPTIAQIVALDEKGFTVPLSDLAKIGFYLDAGLFEISLEEQPTAIVTFDLSELVHSYNSTMFLMSSSSERVMIPNSFDYGFENASYLRCWVTGDAEFANDTLVTVRLSKTPPNLEAWDASSLMRYALHPDPAYERLAQEELAKRFEKDPWRLLSVAMHSFNTDASLDATAFAECLGGYYANVLNDTQRLGDILDELGTAELLNSFSHTDDAAAFNDCKQLLETLYRLADAR
jgi:hypothetical protein